MSEGMKDDKETFQQFVCGTYNVIPTTSRREGRLMTDEEVKTLLYRYDPVFAKAYIAWIEAGRLLKGTIEKRWERPCVPPDYWFGKQPVGVA